MTYQKNGFKCIEKSSKMATMTNDSKEVITFWCWVILIYYTYIAIFVIIGVVVAIVTILSFEHGRLGEKGGCASDSKFKKFTQKNV